MYTHALVRPPGDSFCRAISQRGLHPDVRLARAQHDEYCQALRAAGLDLTLLSPDERYPDSCFVQDTAMVIRGQAVICRPGAPTRAGEEEEIAAWFVPRFSLARIATPGTIEGGDVMILPERVLVGASERTNASGIEQLGGLLAPLNLPVHAVPIGGYLHLLSAATYLGQDTLLAVADYAERPEFAGLLVIVVPPEEAYAANALALGTHIVLPDGFPKTAAQLKAHGFEVLAVPLSKFEKADGGATCLSIVW